MADTKKAFSHLDDQGKARMVDIGAKPVTVRTALASGCIAMAPETMKLLVDRALPKGDVLAVARVAGIMAAKETSRLIPMCHPLAIEQVKVDFEIDEARSIVNIRASVRVSGKTGVEMEALTAVSAAALTVYDMCKAVDKKMSIGEIRLLEKRGGSSDAGTSEGPGSPPSGD